MRRILFSLTEDRAVTVYKMNGRISKVKAHSGILLAIKLEHFELDKEVLYVSNLSVN